jgi:hypothetical protein
MSRPPISLHPNGSEKRRRGQSTETSHR